MPDFNKLAFKPIKDSKELTIPEGFDLMSLKRHEMAKQHQQAKLLREAEEEQRMRKFKSKAVPDYESLQLCIMPSDKPITVAVKPVFASDSLPKKPIALPTPATGPKDFVF